MTFSRSSIVEALKLFDGWTTTNEFDRFLLLFSLETIAPAGLGSKPTRINALIRHLIANPSLTGPDGADLTLEIIEYLLTTHARYAWGLTAQNPLTDQVPELSRSLARDGYSILNTGRLRSVLPPNVPMAPSESELEAMLINHGFTVPLGHLQQALAAHTRGDWAAANAQLRSFIEGVFDSIADDLLTPPLPTTSRQRRNALSRLSPPFIDPALNEWHSNGKGFLEGFWHRLHPQGSHPGLSGEEDCTFRLQMVVLVGHHFVKRFDTLP